jgi:Flp pilus assembly protein CpaB
MEASTQNTRSQVEAFRRFTGTRRGALTVAFVAAALAGIVLLAFASRYKNSVQGGNEERTALIADRLIPKGTSGDLVVSGSLFRQAQVRDSDLSSGAVTDGSVLAGRVATRDIYPGQQITSGDFAANADPLRGQLKGGQRAISIPVDDAHGLVGEVRTGDYVDILAGFNSTSGTTGQGRAQLRTLMQDVLVLKAPSSDSAGKSGSQNSTNVTVRVAAGDAAKLAFAADNGKVWIVLRPPTGGSNPTPSPVNLDSLLSGSPSISTGGK